MRRAAAVGAAVLLALAAAAVPLPVSAHTNDVRVDPQVSADGTVVVETAFIADDGWLVLHADDDGSPGEPIGHTAISSEDGLKEDVPVRVDAEHWDGWEPSRVHAALHRDDGDGEFEPGEDGIITSFGSPATDAFTLAEGDAALATAREFAAQETDDRTLTVRQVRLPSDGHLVVRNTTETGSFEYEPTEPVGATALDAGTHQNVTVTLNRSFYRSTDREFRVSLAVYRDGGDGPFGAGDEPVRVAGADVGTIVTVERTASVGTATATSGAGGDTADATDTAEGDLVRTATRTDAPGGDADAPDGAGDDGTESVVVTASSTASPSSSPTGGQSGFGFAAVAALAALLAGLAAGRRRRT